MAKHATSSFLSDRLIRKIRLGAGLVMFVFVVLHFGNHALGLISVSAANQARYAFLAIWRNPVGTLVLYGAILAHTLLTLHALYIRRSLIMPKGEAAALIAGLLLPLLLIGHVVGTRVAHALYGYVDDYATIVRILWISAPQQGVIQTLALLLVWFHGCAGIHFWLRYRSWYRYLVPALLTFSIMLPVLALLGFSQMGRSLADAVSAQTFLSGDYWRNPNIAYTGNIAAQHHIDMIRLGAYLAFLGALLLVFAARAVRAHRIRSTRIMIGYQNGARIRIPRGFSVLEASRLGHLPHYAVCGSKGQCSTCRVQILTGLEHLSPPASLEQKTLDRIGAPPDVRLACLLRPERDIVVAPLLVPGQETVLPMNAEETNPGHERDITVLFCDLRNFTALSENRLPFDIVFLLNRYFSVFGQAVERAGGQLDKFIGDGAMAFFGLGVTPDVACRQALNAAASIVADVEKLSHELSDELTVPLQIAIGIHTGPAVVGTLGYGKTRTMTAIGDTVNIASRMEGAAKSFNATMVVSEPVIKRAGFDADGLEMQDIVIRGRKNPIKIYVIERTQTSRFLGTIA